MADGELQPLQSVASASAPDEAPARPARRIIVTAVVSVLVMVCVFAVLFPSIGSYQQALAELRAVPVIWAVALVVAGVANIALFPLTVVVSIPELPYRHCFVESQSGFVISNTIPGGGAITVGTQFAILTRYRVRPAVAAAAVSADAIWTYLLTLSMPTLALVLLAAEGRSAAGYAGVAAIGAVVVVLSVVIIGLVLRSDRGAARIGRLAERVASRALRRRHRDTPPIAGLLVEFRSNAAELVRTRWGPITVANVVTQLTPLVVLLCAAGGLGLVPSPVSLIELFAAYSLAIVLASFPITPGGLGTVDAALVGLLVAFGADTSTAVAADLVWRLVWFLPQVLAGVVTLGVYLLGKRHSRAAAA